MADKTTQEANTSPQAAQGGEEGKASEGKISKREAVRRALEELGPEAKPLEIKTHVKERFGIDMSTDHISTSKGEIRRQQQKKKKKTKKAAARKPAARKPTARKSAARKSVSRKSAAPKPQAQPAPGGVDRLMEDIRSLKALVKRVGEDRLRYLIDMIAR